MMATMDDPNKTNYINISNSSGRIFICTPDKPIAPVTKNTVKEKLMCNQVQNINNFYQQNGNLIYVNIDHFPSQNQTIQSMTNPQSHSPVENNLMRVPKNSTLSNSNLIYVNVNNQLNSAMEINKQSLKTTDTLIETDHKDNMIKNIEVNPDPISTLHASAESHTVIDITDNENGYRQDADFFVKRNAAIVKNIKDNTNTIIDIDVNPDPISTLHASAGSQIMIDITNNENSSRQDPDLVVERNTAIVKNIKDNTNTFINIDDDPDSKIVIDIKNNENSARQHPDFVVERNAAIVKNIKDNTNKIINIDVNPDPISTLNASTESHTIIDLTDNENGYRQDADLMIQVNPAVCKHTEDKTNTFIDIDVDRDPIITQNASADCHTIIDITNEENGSRQDPDLMIEVNAAVGNYTKDNTNTIINIDVDPDPNITQNVSAKCHTIIDITDNENDSRQDPDLMIVDVKDNKETQTIIDLTDNDDIIYDSKNKQTEIANGSLLTDDEMLCEKYYKEMSELTEMDTTPEINIDYLLNDINIDDIVKALNESNGNDQSENNDDGFVKASTMVLIDSKDSQSSIKDKLNLSEPLDTEKLTFAPIIQLDTSNLSQSTEKLNVTSSSQAVKDTKLHTSNHSEKLATSTISRQVQGQTLQIENSRNDSEKLPAASSSNSDTGKPSHNEKFNAAPSSLSEKGRNIQTNKTLNTVEKLTTTPSSRSHTAKPSNCNEKLNAASTTMSENSKNAHTIKTFNTHEKQHLSEPLDTGEKLTCPPITQLDTCNLSQSNEKLNAASHSLALKDTKLHRSSEKLATSTSSQQEQGQNLQIGKPRNSGEKLPATPSSQSDTGKPSNFNEKLNAAPSSLSEKGRNIHTNKTLNTVEKLTATPSSRSHTAKHSNCNEKLNATSTTKSVKNKNVHTGKTFNTHEKQHLSEPLDTGEKLTCPPITQLDTCNLSQSNEKLNAASHSLALKDTKLHRSSEKLATSTSSQQEQGQNLKIGKPRNGGEKLPATPSSQSDTGKPSHNEKFNAAPSSLSEKGRNIHTNKTLNTVEKLTTTPSSRSHTAKPSNCNEKLNATSTTMSVKNKNVHTSKTFNTHESEPLDTGEKLSALITQLDTSNLTQSNEKLNATSSSQAVNDTKLHTSSEKVASSTSSQQVQGQNLQIGKSRNSGEKLPATPSSQSDTGKPSNFNEKFNVAPSSLSEKCRNMHTDKTLNTVENMTATPSSRSHTAKSSNCNEKLNAASTTMSENSKNVHTSKTFNTHKYLLSAPASLSEKGRIAHTNKSLNGGEKLTTSPSSRSYKDKPYYNEILSPTCDKISEKTKNVHTSKTNNIGEKITSALRPHQVEHQKLHKSKRVNRGEKLTPPISQPIKDQNIRTNKPFHSGEKSTKGARSQSVKNSNLYTSKCYNIDRKLATPPSLQQQQKFEEPTISPRSQTTTVPNVHLSKSKKYNNNSIKDQNLHAQKSLHKTKISVKTPKPPFLEQQNLLGKLEKKKIKTSKHNYIRTTAKNTIKKDSLIATQNNHQVITKEIEMKPNIKNNSEHTTHNIINKSNIGLKSTFGAIINCKVALKNYVIPKIRRELGKSTLTKTKPSGKSIDFGQSHVKRVINTNKENKCKDAQSENSYCELSLIRDEINKFMSCRNECASFGEIEENKIQKYDAKICENIMKICCNDENIKLYKTEHDVKKNIKYIDKKRNDDPRTEIANNNELIQSLPLNERKRKLIDVNEKRDIKNNTDFKLKKFENNSGIKKQISINTKGSIFMRSENSKTNAKKRCYSKLNEKMITLEDNKSETPKYVTPPKKICTTITKNNVKLLNELYAARRDNKINNTSTEQHQHSGEKTSRDVKKSAFCLENVTTKDNAKPSIKTVISLKSLKNLSKKRSNGTNNKNSTPKAKKLNFTEIIETSRKGIPSVAPPCAADKESNIVNESFGEITCKENTRINLIKQNSSNYTSRDVSGQSDIKSNLDSVLHSSLVGRYNIDCVLYKGQHSCILKARNKNNNRIVAVKILLKMSVSENQHIEILTKLADADKTKYFSCIEFEDIFWARHWCITMEYYPQNLIQALESCGTGLTIEQVQELSWQLLTALLMLRVTQILHTDIKPSHILINAEHTRLKLTGFDKAMYDKQVTVSPHIGTLNYRSPEIFLGINISYPADIWSSACTMFEMATKQKLFQGADNHSVLENIICLRGMFSDQLLSEGIFSEDCKCKCVKMLTRNNILNKLFNVYNSSISKSTNECRKIIMFSDLLDSMLTLNHSERKTVELAYVHPFISKQQ